MPAQIVNYVVPPRLFRYRSLRRIGSDDTLVLEREFDAIEQNYLWCSDYLNLNDPMEGAFYASSRVRADERFDRARRLIRDGKAELGLCAFSEVKNHELLWAHYADEYRGICVSYNFSRLCSGLADSFSFARIFYTEEPPKMGKPGGNPMLDVRRILSTKNYRWLYEREWRMFAPHPGHNDYRVREERPAVAAIYLGYRMDEWQVAAIRTRMRGIGIPIYQMTLDKYSIRFDEAS